MKYSIEGDTLTSIADTVRSAKGTTDKIPTMEISTEMTTVLDNFRKLIEGGGADLVIPYGTTKIGDLFFCHESTLKSIYIPSTVTTIGVAVFERGRGLKSIVIPDSVTEMGNYVFYGNYDIETVVIGDGVPSLGSEVFYQCVNLKKITFGKGLKTIGYRTFADASNRLTYDFSKCESIPTMTSNTAFVGINANAKIIVPGLKYFSWIAATNWASYSSNITYPDTEMPFTIYGMNNVYTATKGMTWREWVNSVGHTYGYTLSGDGDTAGVILPQSISGGVELWVTDASSGSYEIVQANQTIKCTHYTGW